jgi:hypothetical protein
MPFTKTTTTIMAVLQATNDIKALTRQVTYCTKPILSDLEREVFYLILFPFSKPLRSWDISLGVDLSFS